MRRKWLICFFLAAMTLAVYWQVQQHEFLAYDDPAFITENPQVQAGLSWSGLHYAFTAVVAGNWHPVTTLSHMLDCQLFGVNAGAHLLVNVALHAANALLLFWLLHQLTGAVWRSALVAALFALHPLRVESVAWISERKDVLSGLFFLLTLLAYVRYAGRSKASGLKSQVSSPPATHSTLHAPRSTLHVSFWYVLTLVLFALGLMSKPMLVTLPCVLLLLDYWPLRRWELRELRRKNEGCRSQQSTATVQPDRSPPFNLQPSTFSLLLEKVPFFALAALCSWVTFVVQRSAGAVISTAKFSLEDRACNALVSYARYLGKLVWPTHLAAMYPRPTGPGSLAEQPGSWPLWVAVLLLAVLTAGCLYQARRRPFLVVGWLWFLGMLVPVIGLVQVGEQAMADRYTYLPLIGPVLSLVWLAGEWRHAEGRRSNPPPATGHPPQSILNPLSSLLALSLLGACLVLTYRQVGYWHNTVALFEHTLAVTTRNPTAEFALGAGLEREGRAEEALAHYRAAVALAPDYNEPHYNLGQMFRKRGEWQAAADEYVAALRGKPNDVASHLNLAGVLLELGRVPEAVTQFETALANDPNSVEALNNLAWLLASSEEPGVRNGPRAIQLAQRACALTGWRQTVMIGTLAAAYAEAGQFSEAVASAEKACATARQNGETELLEKNQQLLQLYKLDTPCREASAAATNAPVQLPSPKS